MQMTLKMAVRLLTTSALQHIVRELVLLLYNRKFL